MSGRRFAVAFVASTVVCGAAVPWAAEASSPGDSSARACSLVDSPFFSSANPTALLRVCDDGTIEETGPELDPYGGGGGCGLRGALPSPDGEWVAFTRDNDLSLYNAHSGREVPVTWVGRPYEQGHAEVFAGIIAWSPDSRRLVHVVCPGETEAMCEPLPEPIRTRPAAYGYYVFDLATGASTPVDPTLPSDRLWVQHFAWLADGSFLLASEDATPAPLDVPSDNWRESGPVTSFKAKLWWLTPGGGTPRQVLPLTGLFTQPNVTADRKRVAFSVGTITANGGAEGSQIWTFDLTTGAATPASPVGGWARYQQPRWSPSGTRLAYDSRVGSRDGQGFELLVDEKVVYADQKAGLAYRWVTDTTILLMRAGGRILLDVDTGRILAHRCSADPDLGPDFSFPQCAKSVP